MGKPLKLIKIKPNYLWWLGFFVLSLQCTKQPSKGEK